MPVRVIDLNKQTKKKRFGPVDWTMVTALTAGVPDHVVRDDVAAAEAVVNCRNERRKEERSASAAFNHARKHKLQTKPQQ